MRDDSAKVTQVSIDHTVHCIYNGSRSGGDGKQTDFFLTAQLVMVGGRNDLKNNEVHVLLVLFFKFCLSAGVCYLITPAKQVI
jgi:hypothetical protein